MAKLEKLFKVIYLLHSGQIFSAASIGESLDISARNARAYINTLIESGVPIASINGRRGGYYIDKRYFLEVPALSGDEIIALEILKDTMTTVAGKHYNADMISAITKIMLAVKRKDTNNEQSATGSECSTQHPLALFHRAIEKKRKVKIVYKGTKDTQAVERITCPYQIVFRDSMWYIYALCEMRREKRLFCISRIKAAELLDTRFHMDDDEAFYREMEKAFNLYRGEKEYKVKIKFQHPASLWVKERVWIDNQEIEEYGDKEISFSCIVKGLDTIERWVLSFGDMATVIEPPELTERLKATMKRTLEMY